MLVTLFIQFVGQRYIKKTINHHHYLFIVALTCNLIAYSHRRKAKQKKDKQMSLKFVVNESFCGKRTYRLRVLNPRWKNSALIYVQPPNNTMCFFPPYVFKQHLAAWLDQTTSWYLKTVTGDDYRPKGCINSSWAGKTELQTYHMCLMMHTSTLAFHVHAVIYSLCKTTHRYCGDKALL